MSFGARLAEERKRLGLTQADFARLVGSDPQKQSLYENDRRALRADYLSRLSRIGVDVVYVLTGERSVGEWLSPGARDLLSAYLCMKPEMQRALEQLAAAMRGDSGAPPTVHSRRNAYRGERGA